MIQIWNRSVFLLAFDKRIPPPNGTLSRAAVQSRKTASFMTGSNLFGKIGFFHSCPLKNAQSREKKTFFCRFSSVHQRTGKWEFFGAKNSEKKANWKSQEPVYLPPRMWFVALFHLLCLSLSPFICSFVRLSLLPPKASHRRHVAAAKRVDNKLKMKLWLLGKRRSSPWWRRAVERESVCGRECKSETRDGKLEETGTAAYSVIHSSGRPLWDEFYGLLHPGREPKKKSN